MNLKKLKISFPERSRMLLMRHFLSWMLLSKLDGTAKGGSVISIIDELKLPIKFIGTGEGEKDLIAFSPSKFASALLS
jgi:fused signal recognition particle receptor